VFRETVRPEKKKRGLPFTGALGRGAAGSLEKKNRGWSQTILSRTRLANSELPLESCSQKKVLRVMQKRASFGAFWGRGSNKGNYQGSIERSAGIAGQPTGPLEQAYKGGTISARIYFYRLDVPISRSPRCEKTEGGRGKTYSAAVVGRFCARRFGSSDGQTDRGEGNAGRRGALRRAPRTPRAGQYPREMAQRGRSIGGRAMTVSRPKRSHFKSVTPR